MISFASYTPLQKGFTLVELIVVFSVMAILSTAGIAAFVDFSRQQTVNTAAQDLKTLLIKARSQAASQVSRCSTGQTFSGYDVLFCPTSGSIGVTACNSQTNTSSYYQLDIRCDSSSTSVADGVKLLPPNVYVTPGARTLRFSPITGAVSAPYDIGVPTQWSYAVVGYGKVAPTITVYSDGVIK